MKSTDSASDGVKMAIWDFVGGFMSWRLWAFFGLHDIRQRYRRSTLGPLWLALGLGVTIAGIGILYSQILKTDPGTFVPFIAISLLIWNLISVLIMESTTLFVAGAGLITSTRIPYTSFALRALVRNLIVAAHCAVPVVIAFLIYKYPVDLMGLAALPGLMLIVLNLYWISICIGMICLRFRDVAQIVIYLTQLALFLTPIIWMPTQIRPASPYIHVNPFYHLINLVRGPIFYHTFPAESFVFAFVMLLIGMPATALFVAKYRRHLVFWI